MLDVHPATVRQWADNGRIRSYRTPGGHRRFAEEDIRTLMSVTAAPAAEFELLLSAAMGRTRLELTNGRLDTESWYTRLDEDAKQQHRMLGRELLGALIQYLSSDNSESVLNDGRDIGMQYAALAHDLRLSVSDATRAFLMFRDVLMESLVQISSLQGTRRPQEMVAIHRQVSLFTNEVLAAMLSALSKDE